MIIEGKSLFNDGIGVTLFIILSGIVSGATNQSAISILFEEVVGAILVALLLSFILFKLLERTQRTIYHIAISLLNVSLTYVVCEYFGLSLALVISASNIVSQGTYDIFLAVTFATIAFTTIIQGLTTPKAYQLIRKLTPKPFLTKKVEGHK